MIILHEWNAHLRDAHTEISDIKVLRERGRRIRTMDCSGVVHITTLKNICTDVLDALRNDTYTEKIPKLPK